jgi:hypothetical protein
VKGREQRLHVCSPIRRTGLSGPVIVRQAGTAVNDFGAGLILPFEIIYLHEVRSFTTATAGLMLAAVISTAAVVTLPAGALLDRVRAKQILSPAHSMRGGAPACSPACSRLTSRCSSAAPSTLPKISTAHFN